MVFSTFEFMFQFLPVFLIVYYITPWRYRNITLIIGSLIFYGQGAGWFTLLLLLSLFVNYTLSRYINMTHNHGSGKAKNYLIGGLVFDFGLLAIFKYTNFVTGTINSLIALIHIPLAIPEVNITLPLGISFYTFQITSYLIDVYKKQTKPAKSILELGTYMCMFPQLISGPITTFSEMRVQFMPKKLDITNLEKGLETFVFGLGAKVLLADPMNGLWNNITTIGFDSISTPYAWLGAFAYSFEIYFDFAGYSMMAIGVGYMLGFQLPQNFNLPYMSGSVKEFWRRWHITLGRWFKNYIYIPLGGNRVSYLYLLRNLLAVWAFTGLWHGASWNFVLWGLIFFVLQVLENGLYGKALEKTKFLKHAYIIFIIPLTWMVFAITDLHDLGVYFTHLFPFLSSTTIEANTRDFANAFSDYWKILIPCVLFCTPLPLKYYKKYRKSGFFVVFMLIIFIWAVKSVMTSADNPFMYFQF